MNSTGVLFLAVALITLVAAWRVVVSPKIMHAALWLGLTFFGVATVFLLLGADFVAAAQVLVYVGAITVLLIFGIMLSDSGEVRAGPAPGKRLAALRKGTPAALAASGFAALMLVLYHRAGWRVVPPQAAAVDTPREIGRLMFGEFIIPFEVASLVLLVGLIGAIVLAMREEG